MSDLAQPAELSLSLPQWSFGVTMWEVFNGGRNPYPGVDAHALPNLLHQGHRLEMPSNAACSEQM